MKKTCKIAIIFLITFLLMSICFNTVTVYAELEDPAKLLDPLDDPGKYIPGINWGVDNTKLVGIGNIILGVIRVIGSFVAVAILMILGIKYMMGSVEEKADYKQAMLPYIIGAIMLFTIPNLLGILYDMVEKLM